MDIISGSMTDEPSENAILSSRAHHNNNTRASQLVGAKRRSIGSSPIPGFFRRCPLLLPIFFFVLGGILENSKPTFFFRSNNWIYRASAWSNSRHVLQRCPWHFPSSTGCKNPPCRHSSADNRILLGASSTQGVEENSPKNRIRLNKVFKRTHSRREADRLIEEGRVSVNGEKVTTKGGFFVVPYVDEISLDGKIVEGWEEMNYVANGNNNNDIKTVQKKNMKSSQSIHNQGNHPLQQSKRTNQKGTIDEEKTTFEYIKYWKPRGVICTTDPNIPGNIVDEMREHDGYDPPHRVYPVGRLDKETTGLILLTSDGRLPNAALRKEHKRPKVYEVRVEPPLGPLGSPRAQGVVQRLARGVTISTETVRNGIRKTLTAPTEPCEVEQLDDRWIRITLREGRNRQVRKMTRAVGHRTVELERVSFAGIPLEPGLRGPGDWDYLRGSELAIVRDMIRIAEQASAREMEGRAAGPREPGDE